MQHIYDNAVGFQSRSVIIALFLMLVSIEDNTMLFTVRGLGSLIGLWGALIPCFLAPNLYGSESSSDKENSHPTTLSFHDSLMLHKCRALKRQPDVLHLLDIPGISTKFYNLRYKSVVMRLDFDHLPQFALERSRRLCAKLHFKLLTGLSEALFLISCEMNQRAESLSLDTKSRNYLDEIEAELQILKTDIESTISLASKSQFISYRQCFHLQLNGSAWRTTLSSSKRCEEEERLTCNFAEYVDRIWCWTHQLNMPPLSLDIAATVREVIESTIQSSFPSGSLTTAHSEESVAVPALLFSGQHLTNYGHAMMDNLFCIYAHLRSHRLLDQPLALVVVNRPDPAHYRDQRWVFEQLANALGAFVAVEWTDPAGLRALGAGGALESQGLHQVDPDGVRPVQLAIRERFLRRGLAPDHVYAPRRSSPLLHAYVGRLPPGRCLF